MWVEKTHGERGSEHIARQVAQLAACGDRDGIAMWKAVSERYGKLRQRRSLN